MSQTISIDRIQVLHFADGVDRVEILTDKPYRSLKPARM